MKSRRLGKTGLSVSEIGMGTMTFGSFADEATSHAILDRAFDAGIDFLDVAEMYPVPPRAETAGRSEEICGKWLAGRPRDSIILATKVSGPGGGWFLGPMRSGHTSLDRFNIERAVEDSLRRLGTDYIDLYQTHWPDGDYPIEDTLEALDRLVEEGVFGDTVEKCAVERSVFRDRRVTFLGIKVAFRSGLKQRNGFLGNKERLTPDTVVLV